MPTLGHTPHTNKQIIEHVIASHTSNIVPITNYRSVKPQNDPTFYEHATQGLHIVLGGAYTSRNQPKCNHSIYDYMRLVVVCN